MHLMKTFVVRTACAVLGLLVVATFLGAAEPAIDFIGVMNDGGAVRVALNSRGTGNTSWLKLGQTFDGYTVIRYEASTDTVVVQKDGTEFPLHLASAKVRAGQGEIPPEVKQRVLNNLRQLSAAADQYFLEHGVSEVTYDRLVGPEKEKYIKAIVPVDGEDYRSIRLVQGKGLEVRTRQGFVVSYAY